MIPLPICRSLLTALILIQPLAAQVAGSARVRSTALSQLEYHLTTSDGVRWTAPNRSQGIRVRWSQAGIEVFPRSSSTPHGANWSLRLSTTAFGRTSDVKALVPGVRSALAERLDVSYGPLNEWFVNDERGVQQAWSVSRRPMGSGNLVIQLGVGGGLSPRVIQAGKSLVFLGPDSKPRLRYGELLAWDARGVVLPAWMRLAPGGFEVCVDDSDATYPLTIDPLMTSPDWNAESDQAGAEFGSAVSSAGDVNGDGFDDIIIGAQGFDVGQVDEGRAYVFYGSAVGPSLTADWIQGEGQAGARFGSNVASAGDVNGDGFDDVLVAATDWDGSVVNQGRAFVYLGSPSGLGDTAAWSVGKGQLGSKYGLVISSAGDVNGDGYDDVIVGSSRITDQLSEYGRIDVYHGSSAGLGLLEAWGVSGDQLGSNFGVSASGAGDVNGDGFDDIIIGASDYTNSSLSTGRVFVYYGSPTGIQMNSPWVENSPQFGSSKSSFGMSVSNAGDVNGDGFDDVIVGSRNFIFGGLPTGRVHVYHGGLSGLGPVAAWTADGLVSSNFGRLVAGGGDFNRDGYSDVLVNGKRPPASREAA